MSLNIALKFPRISRLRPILATVITAKCTFLSELRREKKQTEIFCFHENVLGIFFWEGGRKGSWRNKNEKLGNSLKLSLLLWIIFCKSDLIRFSFMCE